MDSLKVSCKQCLITMHSLKDLTKHCQTRSTAYILADSDLGQLALSLNVASFCRHCNCMLIHITSGTQYRLKNKTTTTTKTQTYIQSRHKQPLQQGPLAASQTKDDFKESHRFCDDTLAAAIIMDFIVM